MSRQDIFNIRCAKADAEAEEDYWRTQEEEDEKRYKQCEEKILRQNYKKTCSFCKERGHVVYQMAMLTCPLLKKNKCRTCGVLGHTPKFCAFIQNSNQAKPFTNAF